MNRTLLIGIGIGFGSLLYACSAHEATGNGGGGGSVAPGTKVSGLYIANSDDNTIARLDLDTHVVTPYQLGKEPSRIAHAGTRIYVTLRNERSVVVLDDKLGEPQEVGRLKTASEPFGVAANDTRIYVAASVGGVVHEFDATSLEQLRSWEIPGEPKWLSLHPSNRSLFVGSTYGGHLTRIDLDSGRASEVALPQIQTFSPTEGRPIILTARITGDLAASPDGNHVYAPMMYVDNTTKKADVSGDTSTPPPDDCMGMPTPGGPIAGDGTGGASGGTNNGMDPPPPPPPPPNGMGCGGGYNSSQTFNPAVTDVKTDPGSGEVMTLAPETIAINGAVVSPDGNGVQVNGYPSSLQITADSKIVFATIEGANAVIAINVDVGQQQGGGVPGALPAGAAGGANFSFRPSTTITVGAGPRGVATVNEHKAYVHAFFDHQIEEINLDAVRSVFSNNANPETNVGIAPPPSGGMRVSPGFNGFSQLASSNPTIVTSPTLSQEAEAGRRLFFAANNPTMATVGAGVSCATCHFDSRTDGVTWSFQRGQRQTPMLAADLQHDLPVGWAGNVASVADEGFNTSQKLMGGHGISQTQLDSIQNYLFGLRTTDSPMKGSDDPAVQHGLQIFNQVGCVSCHNGPSHTNNQVQAMFELQQVKTRPLASIAASAPYFHDGSALTLDDVIVRASRGEMGQAFQISDSDRGDLVKYLESL